MNLYRRIWIFFTGFFFFSFLPVTIAQNTEIRFNSPVRFPIHLSSNFGEIRPDHFHSGIDIKTNGRIGENVYAIEKGYISRIKISLSGFGKAVYVTHPDGYTSVYAHLSRFAEEISNYVIGEQYKRKSYTVDMFPEAGLFKVRKGQLVGYSGNTGNSSGPHLHFEIRETQKEAPVNPLLFHFPVVDTIAPKLFRLYIYPESKTTLINNRHEKQMFRTKPSGLHIYSLADTIIHVTGPFSLGLEAQDYINGSNNRCGVYSFKLLVDNQLFFYYTMDEFTYGETRYINSYIDYKEKIKENRNVIRTIILPNNKLDIYKKVLDKGIVNFSDERIHQLEFIISDIDGNTSRLVFYAVKTVKPVPLKTLNSEDNYLSIMPYNRDNYYSFDKFRLFIPRLALYDTLVFHLKIKQRPEHAFSSVYQIQDAYTPLQLPFTVWIQPDYCPDGKEDKLLIAEVSNPGQPEPAGGKWNGEKVTGTLSKFGTYTLLTDTVPPDINPLFDTSKVNFHNVLSLRFIIRDNLAGIATYNGTIDGQWVLFEYEPKRKLLLYRFDKKRLSDNQPHHLILEVTDKTNNIAIFEKDFFW